MPQTQRDLERVHDFYCLPRSAGESNASIYEIWERGEAFKDSVTPSTYVPEYRSHIVLKVLSLTPAGGTVMSLGCGNGFVEGDLAAHDRVVRAIDCNEEAVALTRAKGVDAFTADFFALQPEDVAAADLVYADGLLGHLFDPSGDMNPSLAKLASLGLKSGAHLLLSNDSPRDPGVPYAPHDSVEGFWFISKDYLRKMLVSFGFEPDECYYFPYKRPLSGIRNRTICVARVP
ncbi:MAG TPA: methyltransferase domain-containing protein [Streptosporangiaceae bacterium]|nr:methyltransferase domain-containing protein [Streptosporangiaceae bacterium]